MCCGVHLIAEGTVEDSLGNLLAWLLLVLLFLALPLGGLRLLDLGRFG
jgi:hypothetical protein